MKNEFKEILDVLIKTYCMSTDSLSILLGINKTILDNFYRNTGDIPPDKFRIFGNHLVTLGFIPEITADERTKGFIDILNKDLHISIESIALLAKIKIDDISNFLNNSESVSYEIKYKLASVCNILINLYQSAESGKSKGDISITDDV